MSDTERFAKIESVFAQAIDRPRAERAAYLDAACAGDADTRTEVERLLAYHEMTSPLDAVQPGEVARLLATDIAQGFDTIPDTIGRYEVLRVIGEGGMGTVYEARQDEPRRSVALKVIKLGMDTKRVIARFEAERQALAMMDHPSIAKVFDAGTTEMGRPYFVMELVQGEPILSYCDSHNMSTRARLEMFGRVCSAIQHAHVKGIIHRDIKPSNILVTTQDGVPVPKVIDFGIAKAANTEQTQKTSFTEHGQVIGTPVYMSPEQAEVTTMDIDTRADVYALGVLLYELLTGTTPFRNEDLLSKGYAEMMRIIRETEPRRPSTQLSTLGDTAQSTARCRNVDVTTLASLLKGDLDWITLKCLEKDRTRRYDSVSALAADIERHLAHEPVVAGPQSSGYRLKKFVRRNRVGVVAASAVACAVALGLVGTTGGLVWALDEREKARDAAISEKLAKTEAQENERIARDAESRAEQRARDLETISDFQAKQLSGIDASLMGDTIASSVLDAAGADRRAVLEETLVDVNFTDIALDALRASIFEPTIQTIETELKEQPEIGSRLFQSVGTSQRELGLIEDALETLGRSIEIRTATHGSEHELTLHARSVRGAALSDLERFSEAASELTDVLETQRRVLTLGHPDTVRTLLYLGQMREAQGDLETAEALIQEAFELAETYPSADEPDLHVVASAYLGYIARSRGRLREALARFEQVLAYREANNGPEATQTLTALGNMTTVLAELGQYETSAQYYEKIYEIRARRNGEHHPQTLAARMNLGSVYWRIGDLPRAETSARVTLELLREQMGDEHSYTLNQLNLLGLIVDRQGRDDEAIVLYDEAMHTSRRVFGDTHPRTLQSINNVAKTLRRLGRLEEAEPLQYEVLEGARALFGDRHPNTLVTVGNTAILLSSLGRDAEAEALYRESLGGCREVYGDEHPETLHSIGDLAAFLASIDRSEEAMVLCDERVTLSASMYGSDQPRHADALRQRAGVRMGLGRYREAERDYLEAHALLRATSRERLIVDDLVALYGYWGETNPEGGHEANVQVWADRMQELMQEPAKDRHEE